MSLDLNDADKQIAVLNKGFVRLIQIAGDDQLIVDAARVSYARQSPKSDDASLIDYLMEMRHTSPFEMVEVWFHLKMPIFIARQWVRHRTAGMNEISGRYSEMKDDFYLPELEELRVQDTVNRQGSGEELVADGWKHQRSMDDDQRQLYAHYQEYLSAGVSKEIARVNLPLALYTEFYWKIDLHNLFHFLNLRLDSHAQPQIRVYAEAMLELIEASVPKSVKSFKRHVLNSEKFSEDELRWLKETLMIDMTDYANRVDIWKRIGGDPTMRSRNDRKRKAFFSKLGLEEPTDVE
jgi:thymidylate synthase (FAD)